VQGGQTPPPPSPTGAHALAAPRPQWLPTQLTASHDLAAAAPVAVASLSAAPSCARASGRSQHALGNANMFLVCVLGRRFTFRHQVCLVVGAISCALGTQRQQTQEARATRVIMRRDEYELQRQRTSNGCTSPSPRGAGTGQSPHSERRSLTCRQREAHDGGAAVIRHWRCRRRTTRRRQGHVGI
jgi:hypothetical protein